MKNIAYIILILALPINQCLSDETESNWYRVELIAFTRKQVRDPVFPKFDDSRFDFSQAIRLLPSDFESVENIEIPLAPLDRPKPWKMLNKDELKLLKTWQKLRRSAAYQPQLHLAWWQPELSKSDNQQVLIDSKQPFASHSSQWPELTPYQDNFSEQTQAFSLLGQAHLYQERYLHLAIELSFNRSTAYKNTQYGYFFDNGKSEHHLIKQDLRVTPNEWYYFDHKYFGVLAYIEKWHMEDSAE